jgi:competence/damage-inducible protein CinA-like protein
LRAELVAVGSELLGPLRAETNTLWLTERLLDAGIEVVARATVADERALLASAFREALSRADVVIATGGLGPTADDLTREAAAAATGRHLLRDETILEALRARFARFGRTMSATNEKQADVVEGARALPNARGTAPGQILADAGRLLVLLPGPPGEMKPMFDEQVLPVLREQAGASRVVRRRVLRIAAMPESEVDERAAPVYSRFENPKTTILGAPGQVELHLVAHGHGVAEAESRIEELAAALRAALPGRIFAEDGRDLPHVVADLLRARGLTLALAESCTGGLLASRLTEVPGVSAVLERAFVTYANRAKVEELGVAEDLLVEHGAVSAEVAAAMAAGAMAAARSDVGVGITGIAGPEGGTAEKPVGLVYVATCGAAGTRVRRNLLPGGRGRVRFQATQLALEMLRRGLLGLPPL